jgi:hypothetical protein
MALQAIIERAIQQKNTGGVQNADNDKPANVNRLQSTYSGSATAEAPASGTAIDLFA